MTKYLKTPWDINVITIIQNIIHLQLANTNCIALCHFFYSSPSSAKL